MMVSIFRTRRTSVDEWSTASLSKGDKKVFMDEMSERQGSELTMPGLSLVDDSETDSASDMLSLKRLRQLEQQLDEKDETISNLRQALEREDERVTRLELQLGALLELSSKEIVRQEAKKNKTKKSKNKKDSNSSSSKNTGDDRQDSEADAKLEISALQELLARVIAEKDRVQHHNHTLKGLLQKCNHPKSALESLNESSKEAIAESKSHDTLDELKRPSSKKKDIKRKISKDSSMSGRNEAQDKPKRSSNDEHRDIPPAIKDTNKSKTVRVTELSRDNIFEQNKASYLYQMSCRNCADSHCHIPYSSTFTTDNDAKKEMPKILKKHYRQVWRIVQLHEASDETASITSSVHEDEWLKSDTFKTFFPSSSFARHLAKHCQYLDLDSEEDVLKFCMQCVKVEMQKNVC